METPMSVEDSESIHLGQVIEFLAEHWKRAAACAVLGAALGASGWFMRAQYKAESVLANNGAVSFLSWRALQNNLPLLASQLIANRQVPPEQETLFQRMSDAKWWPKNVQPTYLLTKADTKDLAALGKDLQEAGGSTILNLVVTTRARSREAAVADVDVVTGFIKSGSAYLSLKSLVKGYESEIVNSRASLQQKIADTETDLKFMRERAKNLEVLRQRFPSNAVVANQQVVDLSDTNAKYMPISTQLVAINTDINNALESVQKLRDQQVKLATLSTFVRQAVPLVNTETDGLKLADSLVNIISDTRKNTTPDDVNALLTLNELESKLVAIRTQFTMNLDTDLSPGISRPSPLQPVMGGFFGGAIAMLLFALIRRTYASYRAARTSGK